ncbi:MAG TPA: BON domain-containing protein [Bryobacteraceae bacterium]|nr:BON domain-containing protein [Bryobacteraceae bacterium]
MKKTVIRTAAFVAVTAFTIHLSAATAANAITRGSGSSFEQVAPVTPAQKELERLLKQISANAATASKHADRLNSYLNTAGQHSRATHHAELSAAKTAINAIGADYRKLQELRPAALPWQQSVIDRLEPVLTGLAVDAGNAVVALNAQPRGIPSQEYRDALANMYAGSRQARSLILVTMDYAQARAKLNRFDASPSEQMASAPAAMNSSSKEAVSLERRVRSELLKLPWYGVFDHLAFQVHGDEVRLTGEVSWPALKANAERAVRGVEGVAAVTSDIRVLPLSPQDDRIRLATYRAIYGQPSLARYGLNPHAPIRIIVENGHVTLKGVVGNNMDRTIAYMQANKVPGVFSVTNSLQVGS